MKLSKVLETVEMLQPVVLDGKRDSGGWYNREALRVILDAGMVKPEDRELLRDVLDTKDLDLLERGSARKSKKKTGQRFRVPLAVKIGALIAAAVLAGVLIFSWCSRVQPSATPGTEQSSAPSDLTESPSPSMGQNSGMVTPRQPDTGE